VFWSYFRLIDVLVSPSALILRGDFFTGAVLATALAKLVLRFDELTSDSTALNMLRAVAHLFLLRARKLGDTDHNLQPRQC
jgi:coatomer subunit beta